jgi:hypothetical protein
MAKNYLIFVISIVWAGTIIASIFNDYSISPAIHTIFGMVVGGVFGYDVVKKKD